MDINENKMEKFDIQFKLECLQNATMIYIVTSDKIVTCVTTMILVTRPHLFVGGFSVRRDENDSN